MPLVERRMMAMESSLSGTLSTIAGNISTLSEQVSDLVSGRVSIQFVRTADVDAYQQQHELSVVERPVASGIPEANSRTIPNTYRMSRGVKAIPDLWREWHTGLAGGVSVQEMDMRFGASWRSDDRQFYSRRRRLIERIKLYATEHSIEEETAVNIAEAHRRRSGKTIDFLTKNLYMIYPA